jgi:hypothetical protein
MFSFSKRRFSDVASNRWEKTLKRIKKGHCYDVRFAVSDKDDLQWKSPL